MSLVEDEVSSAAFQLFQFQLGQKTYEPSFKAFITN